MKQIIKGSYPKLPWVLGMLGLVLAACGPSPAKPAESAFEAAAPAGEVVSPESPTSAADAPDLAPEPPQDQQTTTETPTGDAPDLAQVTPTTPLPDLEPLVIDLSAIPTVDQSRHSVPLEEIYFDTFRSFNRIVPLTDIEAEMREELLDAIPPIYNPRFEPAAGAGKWLAGGDIVLGYADGAAAYAYAIKILNWHEMVSHTVNGRPVLATY